MSDQPNRAIRDADAWLRWNGAAWERCAPANDEAEEMLLAAPSDVVIPGDKLAGTSFAGACLRQLAWIDPGNPILALARSEAMGGRHRPLTFIRERRCAEQRFGPLMVSLRDREIAFADGVPFPSPAARISLPSSASGTAAGSVENSAGSRPAACPPLPPAASRDPRRASSLDPHRGTSPSAWRGCRTGLALLGAAIAGRWALARTLSMMERRFSSAIGGDASAEAGA